MPEPEPVPEPAPPPPRECRRRRRSGSNASSRACRAQRRLHLGMGGGGGGSRAGGAGRARSRPRNPRFAGCPARRPGVGARNARLRETLSQPLQATAPPTEQGRSGRRDPAPCSAMGEGARGRGPSTFIGPLQGRPAYGLGRIPPRRASEGYCYNPGFPRATGMGRDSEHLAPPSTPERNAPPPDSRPLAFPSLRNLMGRVMELAFVP